MQEHYFLLIESKEHYKKLLKQETSVEGKQHYQGAIWAIQKIIDYIVAERMLEKEKEVMESAWLDGIYEWDGDGTFEDFYKTFNTKEK